MLRLLNFFSFCSDSVLDYSLNLIELPGLKGPLEILLPDLDFLGFQRLDHFCCRENLQCSTLRHRLDFVDQS